MKFFGQMQIDLRDCTCSGEVENKLNNQRNSQNKYLLRPDVNNFLEMGFVLRRWKIII